MLDELGVNASPNAYYFFANNYLDGVSRIAHNTTNLFLTLEGKKDFDAKSELFFLDSYIGKKSNFDAREFTKVENQILDKRTRMNALENNPEQYIKYIEKNPMDPIIVEIYNKNIGGDIKKIRSQLQYLRSLSMDQMSPKDKKPLVDDLNLMQNLLKRNMIDVFKEFNLTP